MVDVQIPVERMRIPLRIEVQTEELQSTFGTPQKRWENLGYSVMARVETLSGREVELAQRLFPNATHRVTIPYLKFLTPRHSFVVKQNEKRLEIGHINNVEMANRVHICTCQEVVNSDIQAPSSGSGSTC